MASERQRTVTVRLRAHHLLCLLTYVGKGYTPAFTANYDVVVARLNAGEDVHLVEGPDDICAPMLADGHHCLNASITERDRQAMDAVAALLACRRHDAGARCRIRSAYAIRLRREHHAPGLYRVRMVGALHRHRRWRFRRHAAPRGVRIRGA
jgi:hypothetical protein